MAVYTEGFMQLLGPVGKAGASVRPAWFCQNACIGLVFQQGQLSGTSARVHGEDTRLIPQRRVFNDAAAFVPPVVSRH